MDPNEEDRKQRLYFKNLRKKQRRRRKERKREEERTRQEQHRRERFQRIRSQALAGEEPKQEREAMEGITSGAVVRRIPAANLPVHTKGNCTATAAEQAERMVFARTHVVSHGPSVVAQPASRSQVVRQKDEGFKEINPSNIKLLGEDDRQGYVWHMPTRQLQRRACCFKAI